MKDLVSVWVVIRALSSENLACSPLQIVVPGNTHTVHLEQLIPDTPYSLNIVALYSDAEGNPSPGQGRTCEAQILSPLGPLVTQAGRPGGVWVVSEGCWELPK